MAKEEKLEKIIELSSELTSVTHNEDNSMEFTFKGGLIFEDMSSAGEAPAPATPSEPVEEQTVEDEFTLPETFEIDEKYNTPPTPETPSTVFRPYVPVFTNIEYRMKDDPRPRPKVEEPKPAHITAEKSDSEDIDPIAELEVEAEDVVTVPINGREESAPETLSVFKFADSVSQAMGRKVGRTVEDEKREINELITPKKAEEPEPEPVAEPVEEEPAPQPEPAPAPKTADDYSIPDPTDDMRVIDYGASGQDAHKYTRPDPEGVSDEPPKPKKTKLFDREFNSASERDEFKDAFLDSTLSIKIRMAAMAAIALIMMIYENFIVTGESNLLGSLGIYPGLYGVIDFIFATALFVIAIPETVRAFKYLTYGRIIPELSIVAAFITVLVYTVIISVNDAVTAPLYGLLFGVFAIVTVVSAHFRVNGDFTAFKVITKDAEKQILDRKLTRTLTDENLALDGAIDEYKSRTARIFRAAFISDFFKRTAKVSENSFASIIPMLISFAVALISGVVLFFLKGGIVPAASGFAMIFLTSLPAFSILVHKLPYYDAQMVAHDENSTLVGETSYASFSSVDVIAFEDTDIFGVEDVNLRRIMIYGNNDMEKVLKQMRSLFASVGGPLDLIFRRTILDHQCRPATDITIEADGVCGNVDGSRIFAGTEEYMLRHGIAIPELSSKRETGVDTTKIMYAAENGEIYVKFYIRYSFSEDFTMLLSSIKAEGIVPLIYTRDPNLSNELLKTLSAGSDSMRVMRRYHPITPDDEKIYRRVSAELVTYGDHINAINVILLAKKYKKFAEQLSGTELYSTVFSAAAAVVLALLGVSTVPVIVLSLWHLAWCVVLRVASKKAFPRAIIDDGGENH